MSDNTLVAAEVIAAYVTNNSVPAGELPNLIRAVVDAFDRLSQPQVSQKPAPILVPAVPVKKSVHHDYLISLEDGKRYQTLKRHLSALGMTPNEYRAKWRLSADYPMVAAGYSEKRSEMSKALGLGKKKLAEPDEAPSTTKKPRQKLSEQVEAEAPASTREAIHFAFEAAQEAA